MPAEQIRHHLRAAVAGVVEARQAEPGFHRLEQREVRVEFVALDAIGVLIVGVDQQDDLVGRRILVPVRRPERNRPL